MLESGLSDVRCAPSEHGRVELIVRRPAVDQRELVDAATLDTTEGLVGDTWRVRGSTSTPDGSSNPEAQITLMNDRAATLIAGRDNRAMAGDQIYVDFDISETNLPAGTRISLGTAILEVSVKPHTGCAKFAQRFGRDAMRFVNSPVGRELRLRGVNARVVVGGVVTLGDKVSKVTE